MKIKIEDLDRAVKWMQAHSQDVMCSMRELDGQEQGLQITCKDRYGKYVEMKLAAEGSRSPKIVKEEEIP